MISKQVQNKIKKEIEKDTSKLLLISCIIATIIMLSIFGIKRSQQIQTEEDRMNYLKSLGFTLIHIPNGYLTTDFKESVQSIKVQEFYMSKSEVTVKQYRACVKAGVCSKPDTAEGCNWTSIFKENHPVNCVDWMQARKFAQWVNGKLPTKTQWEYAAKSAGKNWKYPWGNMKASCDYTVMWDKEMNEGSGCNTFSTWQVCGKVSGNTKQGLCDMSGNVAEWLRDGYSFRKSKTIGQVCHISACEKNKHRLHMVCGGSMLSFADQLHTTSCVFYDLSMRSLRIGFRVLFEK